MLGEGTALYCPSCSVATNATSTALMQQPKSSTPRVDKISSEVSTHSAGLHGLVPVDFARQIETELNEANRKLLFANDAAEKGAKGRKLGTALEEAIKENKELSTIADGLAKALEGTKYCNCSAVTTNPDFHLSDCRITIANNTLTQYQTYLKSKKG